MIAFVFQAIILMLSGILIYEMSKFLWNQLTEYKIKKECDKYEDKEFQRDMQKTFKKLGLEWKKQSNCKPSKSVRELAVKVYSPYI